MLITNTETITEEIDNNERVPSGVGTGVVRTRLPPSDIVMNNLARVFPRMELIMLSLLHILQKKFSSLVPSSSSI